jgi:glycosyltransferase involved in cell wall biosynthesis
MYPEMRFGWPSTRRLVRHWRQNPPDLVHIVTEGPLGWSALRAARRLDLPVVSSFHTNFHQYSKYYGYGFLLDLGVRYLRGFHNRTRCTMVPSPDSLVALEERGFERLVEVGRGVDTQKFGPNWRSEGLRRQWGAGPDDPVALYVGRLAEEKNIDLVARAMEETIRTVPGARGVLVGTGPAEKTLRHNHPDLVYCGLRQGEDLATHYASGDLLVFPSLSETFGNVVLEAMASGVAPVAYDCAAAGLHVRDGENGIVLRPGAEEALITATRALASDLTLARRLGAAARATSLSLSWDSIIDRLESVLLASLDSDWGQIALSPEGHPAIAQSDSSR